MRGELAITTHSRVAMASSPLISPLRGQLPPRGKPFLFFFPHKRLCRNHTCGVNHARNEPAFLRRAMSLSENVMVHLLLGNLMAIVGAHSICARQQLPALRAAMESAPTAFRKFSEFILPNSPVAHHTVAPSICQPWVAFAGRRQSISDVPLLFKNAFTLPNGAEPKNPR